MNTLTEPLTGERNILRCDLMEDTGASINPEVDVGQIEGSFVFSLGWWLQVCDFLKSFIDILARIMGKKCFISTSKITGILWRAL